MLKIVRLLLLDFWLNQNLISLEYERDIFLFSTKP